MNIKVKPFLIGSLISVVLLISLNVVSLLFTRSTFDTAFDPTVAPDPSLFLTTSLVSVFSCLCGIISVALGAVAYTYLHNQESQVDVQDGVVGGGAVGAVSYLIAGIFGLLLNLILLPNMLDTAGLPSDLGPEFGSIMVMSSAIGGLFGLCFSLVLGGGIGAGVGAVTASVLNRS